MERVWQVTMERVWWVTLVYGSYEWYGRWRANCGGSGHTFWRCRLATVTKAPWCLFGSCLFVVSVLWQKGNPKNIIEYHQYECHGPILTIVRQNKTNLVPRHCLLYFLRVNLVICAHYLYVPQSSSIIIHNVDSTCFHVAKTETDIYWMVPH